MHFFHVFAVNFFCLYAGWLLTYTTWPEGATYLIRSWMSPPLLTSYRSSLLFVNLLTENNGRERYDGLVISSYMKT